MVAATKNRGAYLRPGPRRVEGPTCLLAWVSIPRSGRDSKDMTYLDWAIIVIGSMAIGYAVAAWLASRRM